MVTSMDLELLEKRIAVLEKEQLSIKDEKKYKESLIVEYGPGTETLYLPRLDGTFPTPIVSVVVFKDSFKLPIELIGIMQKKPVFDVYDLINRSTSILKYLRKTEQKAAIKEAYHAKGLVESEWADVFLVL